MLLQTNILKQSSVAPVKGPLDKGSALILILLFFFLVILKMKEKKNDDLVSLRHDFQMMHNSLVTSCLSIIYGYLETARDVFYGSSSSIG